MDPSNPNPKAYQISGVPVEFPYKPYGSQLAFMGRVISTLDRARKHGHCHALLESPTGTGKSLSLLCSSLAWQHHHPRRFPQPTPGPTPDSLLNGGGFIPEPHTPSSRSAEVKQASAREKRTMVHPTIYYASRTHSQISQVIREYRKTSYRVPMAVLASRKHYCTNKHVCSKENVDEECKFLLKDEDAKCPEFKNAHKVKSHSFLQKGGACEVHDIEDLVKIGRSVKGCSYFASQTLAEEAQIVFCPYSYIINPTIRRAMDIDIKGSIVILDEAHNIEDIARDAGSFDVDEEVLHTLQMELGQLCMDESQATTYQPLYDMIQGIVSWIGEKKDNLQKREFEHHSSYWTGDKAISELQLAGVNQRLFPILQECATKAIRAVSDSESEGAHLSGIPALALERIFSTFGYFFSENGCHASDYQLVLQRYIKRENNNAANGWTCSFSMWCLNPGVVFRDIANLSLSVILTSGTLSPMGSFASELGVQFESCLEAPHVIDVESQLWASVITSGPGNCQLNASYKTADAYSFQDSLGASLEEICKTVPNGALIFFPSYKLLEKLRLRWCQTGQWSRLNAQKTIFIEPRGTDEFETVLRNYYESVRGKGKPLRGKGKGGQKRFSKQSSSQSSPESSSKGGAALLAVCRGKVSEGIDFADENARVVVIVGIPFPNTNDIQVVLKKRYNDTYRSSKSQLSGSDWYCHQAFRALNQAAGRCIRHRSDYGAIILLDERFKDQRNLNYISKWLRSSIKQYDNFDESMKGLQNFFEEKQLSHKGKENVLATSDIKMASLPTLEHNLNVEIALKANQKQKTSNARGRKKITPDNAVGTKVKSSSETNEKPLSSCIEYIDLESSVISRCSRSMPVCLPQSTLDVGNTLKGYQISILGDTCKEGITVETNCCVPDGPSFSCCTTISNGISSEAACTIFSPERVVKPEISDAERESLLNKSVNSYNQRKRKVEDAEYKSGALLDRFNSPNTKSCHQFDNCLDFKPQKALNGGSKKDISSDISWEKKLCICCLSCKHHLGLTEKGFLVACSSITLSKFYLSYVLKHGPRDYNLSECLVNTPKIDINVTISDGSCVDQRMFDRHAKENNTQIDTWCEEDGCVFRSVLCPFCAPNSTCLGVQVKATDASNAHLINKVLFFTDRLHITPEQMPIHKAMVPVCSSVIKQESGLVEIEKFAYTPKLNDSRLTKRKNLKLSLSLPKKEESTCSQNQDEVFT